MNTEQEGSATDRRSLDIESLRLPTKEIHSSFSAQRVSAAELLKQEQNATLPKTHAPSASRTPVDSSHVQPLQTFKGDIAELMRTGGVSQVHIANAEIERERRVEREQNTYEQLAVTLPPMHGNLADATEQEFEEQERQRSVQQPQTQPLATFFGIFFIVVGIGLLGYFALRTRTVAIPPDVSAPFILVDSSTNVTLQNSNLGHSSVMRILTNARDTTTLSPGLVAQLVVTNKDLETDYESPTTVKEFMTSVAPGAPEKLLSALGTTYLLGMYARPQHEPFLIFKTVSYEQAFAGMLLWERTMVTDLSPLFPQSSSTIPTFVDRIVENHDARVLVDNAGTSYLLWTFVNRSTLIITTSEATLHEVILRLKETPVTNSIPK